MPEDVSLVQSYKYSLAARLKWGHPSRQPAPNEQGCPLSFYDCQGRWNRMRNKDMWPKREFQHVRSVVAAELEAILDLDLDHISGGLIADGLLITAEKIEVDGADFRLGPIPIVKATAFFTVVFDRPFTDHDAFLDWQETHGFIDLCVSFFYKFWLDDEQIEADDASRGTECELLLDR